MNIIIKKKEVKKINIKVKSDGQIILTVPPSTSETYIQKILDKRKKWIQEQLDFFQKNHKIVEEKLFVSGESISYLGKNYRLKIHESTFNLVQFERGYIHIYTNKKNNHIYLTHLVKKWYQSKAKKKFDEILQKYQLILKEEHIILKIRKMKKKWGTCQVDKRIITLNLNLIEKPKYCIEYVVLHELIHLKNSYHNKDFYHMLLLYMPDYEWRKKKLEER